MENRTCASSNPELNIFASNEQCVNEWLYKNMLAYFCTAASEHRAKPVSERAKLLSVHCEARKGEARERKSEALERALRSEEGRSP